jgi:hypothetical protein
VKVACDGGQSGGHSSALFYTTTCLLYREHVLHTRCWAAPLRLCADEGMHLQPAGWPCRVLEAWDAAFRREGTYTTTTTAATRFGCLMLREEEGAARATSASAPLVVGTAHLEAFAGHWLPRFYDQQSIRRG